ncbi:hypothetical protein EUBDOL_00108 [Amedibacillus dolichus DSM 3991]|uniref:Uncharacterized protein n=1 Tax=Amedibacillus dolichus DSM 3991 TaxID=428127 RepID=A8R7X6_9FIRM|nr:hypothetical protein EUBDOL_00108 [Amedibacillus dolichus DSM 3991]
MALVVLRNAECASASSAVVKVNTVACLQTFDVHRSVSFLCTVLAVCFFQPSCLKMAS